MSARPLGGPSLFCPAPVPRRIADAVLTLNKAVCGTFARPRSAVPVQCASRPLIAPSPHGLTIVDLWHARHQTSTSLTASLSNVEGRAALGIRTCEGNGKRCKGLACQNRHIRLWAKILFGHRTCSGQVELDEIRDRRGTTNGRRLPGGCCTALISVRVRLFQPVTPPGGRPPRRPSHFGAGCRISRLRGRGDGSHCDYRISIRNFFCQVTSMLSAYLLALSGVSKHLGRSFALAQVASGIPDLFATAALNRRANNAPKG